MTRPKPRRATVTVNSVRSEDNFLATALSRVLQAPYFFLECAPAVRVVPEHVEGGAGGGQEHGVAGDRGEAGPPPPSPARRATGPGQDAPPGPPDQLPGLAHRPPPLSPPPQPGG